MRPANLIFWDSLGGENIWTVSSIGQYLVKMRDSDASIVAMYPMGITGSYHLIYDGENIWVTDYGSSNVIKARASDGMVVGTFAVGQYPLGIAFDGTNMWIACAADNSLNEVSTDGVLLRRVKIPAEPGDVAFDGTHIWVTGFLDGTVMQVGLNGRILGLLPAGMNPTIFYSMETVSGAQTFLQVT
jgi:sugar lactone lactonase YvrE